MLFENRKQVTAEDLMLKYGTRADYNKIVKKPSFEVSKDRRRVDTVNGGVIKTPKASGMRSHFMATNPSTGLKVEIRYAQSSNPKIVGDRVIDNFEPRYVDVKGATFAFQNDIDLAVYLFLHPNNSLSKLRTNKGKAKYEYIDTKKRSEAKMATIDALQEALSHAKNISEDLLIILAKGLGIKGVEKKDAADVRADVMEFASKYPKVYLEKSGTEITYIEGRITNLIDKGIVKLNTVGSIRRWSWTSGEREGEHILDIINVTQDAKSALRNYFFNDISKHMSILNNITNDIGSREKANRELQRMQEEANPVVELESTDKVIGDALPDYLKNQGAGEVQEFKKTIKFTKEDAIEALTDEFGNPPHHKSVEKWLREKNEAEA